MIWVRSILFFTVLFTVTPLMAVFCAPALLLGEGPARACMRVWARLMLAALKAICGVSHRVAGAENIPTGGAVIAANHQSMWETIALFAILPRPVMVFKRELARNPVYGVWAKYGGVAIDRRAGVKAIRDLTRAAEEQVAMGRQLILFPEGTRIKPGTRAAFQPGVAAAARATGAPCVPVAHNSGEHWRHPGPLKTPGEITIAFLPPIPRGAPRKAFTTALERAIAGARADLPGAGAHRPPGGEETLQSMETA